MVPAKAEVIHKMKTAVIVKSFFILQIVLVMATNVFGVCYCIIIASLRMNDHNLMQVQTRYYEEMNMCYLNVIFAPKLPFFHEVF